MKIATMRTKTRLAALSLALSLAGYSLPAFAQDTGEPDKAAIEKSFPAKRPYSPYAGRSFPTRVYWGDTHLHTILLRCWRGRMPPWTERRLHIREG